MDASDIAIALCGIMLGGFLKGATGAGTPVVGVPILAIVFGVPKAVAIFSVLNLLSNAWQAWAYRRSAGRLRFVAIFAGAGALGAAAGSVLLATLSTDVLMGALSAIVFAYIALRVARPEWHLVRARAEAAAGPVGLVGGLMQGAGGISAPVSVTYLNAMRLDRSEFIATISIFFFMMSVLQIPALVALGVLTWDRTGLALLAALPLFAAMPLGARAARSISKETFDKLILMLLAVVALRLGYSAVT
ncbi:MAG: sulfite exporter TauE/SafE family protein [Pseudomonadota bacterium]